QACLDLDLLLSVERVDRPRRPERVLGEAQVELADEIEPVANEALIRADVRARVEVAGRRAELAGMPVPGDPHRLAVVDARRDVHAQAAPHRTPAAAAAIGARPLRDLPPPCAFAARGRAHELPERRAHALPE